MRIKIAVILSALMLTSQVFAASIVNEPVYDNGVLTVTGTADKSNMPVRLEVFKKGVEYSAADEASKDDLSNIYLNVCQKNAEEDGNFIFEVPVDDGLGNYLIRIGFFGGDVIEKSYATYTDEMLNTAIDNFLLNPDRDTDDLETLIEDYYSGLGINYKDLKSLSPEDTELAYANILNEITEGLTKDNLISVINKELAVRQISKNASPKLIESYSTVLGIENELYYQEFLKLSDDKKTELAQKCTGSENASVITGTLKNAVVLNEISTSLWNEVYSVLTKFNKYLNIDFTNLNKVPENSEQRKNIMSDLKNAVANGTVADLSQIASKLNEIVTAYPYYPPTTGNNGGSGGGGGGGTGGSNGSSSISPGSKAPVSSTEPVYTGGVSQEEIEKPFDDLRDYAWAEAAIVKLHELGIVNGKSEKTFDPAGNITREEYTAMIVRGFGLNKTENTVVFSDMTTDRWSFNAICTAVSYGIVNGYENGTFLPEQNIIRQDMAVIAKRAALAFGAELPENTQVTFSDNSEIEEYAIESVNSLAGAGVINGKGGAFVPKGVTSRAEAAVVIYRILDFCNKI